MKKLERLEVHHPDRWRGGIGITIECKASPDGIESTQVKHRPVQRQKRSEQFIFPNHESGAGHTETVQTGPFQRDQIYLSACGRPFANGGLL